MIKLIHINNIEVKEDSKTVANNKMKKNTEKKDEVKDSETTGDVLGFMCRDWCAKCC